MLLYVILVVMSVVFTIATALSVSDFLKILFGTEEQGVASVSGGNLVARWLEDLYVWLIQFGQMKALLLFSCLIFVLYALKNVFNYFSTLQVSFLRIKIIRDIRNDMFAKAMRLPIGYFHRTPKGDIMSRLSSDMVEYDEALLGSVQMLMVSSISMTLYLTMLFYLNLKLTLYVLCMIPLVAVVISSLSRRLKKKSQVVQEMNSKLVSMTDEAIGGLKVIKAYTAIEFSYSQFANYNYHYTRRRTSMFRRIYAASPISEFLGNAIVVSILLFGSWLVMNGDHGLTADLFVSYVMLFVLMIPPAKDLSTAISQMKKGQACTDRMSEFLQEAEESTATPLIKPSTLPDRTDLAIDISNVDFHYTPEKTVLHSFSLKVPKGSTIAIVGSSGSGKSTVADLIEHFYEPQQGTIRFNGLDIRSIPIYELRQHIGVVAQDTLLFNDTVAANIAFGTPNATQKEIEEASRAAQAHDFISDLPQGYQTIIGDRGNSLSGGQRQRISIARALLRKPELLILDEATSALDTESERMVQHTLDNILRGITAIVIAHRLSTIVGADNIVVLENGHIVEQGTHSELLAIHGRYHQLAKLQGLV